jgi:hypothetical protein
MKASGPTGFTASNRTEDHRGRNQSRTRIRQNNEHRQGREEREGRARFRTTQLSELNTEFFVAFVVNSRLITDSPCRPRFALRVVQFRALLRIGFAQRWQADQRLRLTSRMRVKIPHKHHISTVNWKKSPCKLRNMQSMGHIT